MSRRTTADRRSHQPGEAAPILLDGTRKAFDMDHAGERATIARRFAIGDLASPQIGRIDTDVRIKLKIGHLASQRRDRPKWPASGRNPSRNSQGKGRTIRRLRSGRRKLRRELSATSKPPTPLA